LIFTAYNLIVEIILIFLSG